ncbi:ABC transporter permease [Paradesulfitobacterium ferrireducens]|uniref:ABC transporter permease n=1 Tax=Paradesulfitobacterium ferrireducens TaxID=2816476 RepID=UPI001A8EDD31|nr:ABC transporter permease [Paradesulfitobacterium ferrireducens]
MSLSNLASTLSSFINTDIQTAMPIMLAATGMVFSERAGLVNIGIEGVMLMGAFTGVAASFLLGSAWLSLLVVIIIGGILGLFFTFLVETARADQVVIGMAFNLLGLGLTTMLNRALFGMNTAPPKIESFTPLHIPVLSDLPFIGTAFFQHSSLTYIAFVLIPLVGFIVFKTNAGLNLRAVGEHPRAADTVGINVIKVRYIAGMVSCMFGAVGGAYLSMSQLNFFTENMTAGRGFIALAAVIFGKWSPWGVLGAALLFGAGNAVSYLIQASNSQIPGQLVLMVPYVLTLAALAGFVGRAVGPAASGKPYIKE